MTRLQVILLILTAGLKSTNSEWINIRTLESAWKVAESINKFSIDLYKTCSHSRDGNLLLSPFSLAAIMSTLRPAMSHYANDQITSVLYLPGDDAVRTGFRHLLELTENNDGYTFHVSSNLYLPEKKKLSSSLRDFLQQLSRTYNVSASVGQLYRQYYGFQLLTGEASLINSATLSGFWRRKFDSVTTDYFYPAKGDPVTVEMMLVKDYFYIGHIPGLDTAVIELPYQDHRLTMFLLLPTSTSGLSDLENKIDWLKKYELYEFMEKRRVNVTLPKFHLEESLNMEKIMKKLGVEGLFDNSTDVSDDATANDLTLKSFFHKTSLDVTDQGDEPLTVENRRFPLSFLFDQEEMFVVNHPFYFFVQDIETSTTVFVGRYVQP